MVLCRNNTWNMRIKKITSDLYLPMAEPRRWRQAGAVGCLDRWLGQGRGARTPLSPWSVLRGGPWRAHGVVAVLVVGTTKRAAVVATSQRSCSRSISRSATPNHVWSVACSKCMPLSAVIYSVRVILTRTNTLREVYIFPQAINENNSPDNLIDGESLPFGTSQSCMMFWQLRFFRTKVLKNHNISMPGRELLQFT
jgi:hypothetical protein